MRSLASSSTPLTDCVTTSRYSTPLPTAALAALDDASQSQPAISSALPPSLNNKEEAGPTVVRKGRKLRRRRKKSNGDLEEALNGAATITTMRRKENPKIQVTEPNSRQKAQQQSFPSSTATASSCAVIAKDIYVAVRCAYNTERNVCNVLLVSWEHAPLWQATLCDESSPTGWTIQVYSNNNVFVQGQYHQQSRTKVRWQLQEVLNGKVLIGHDVSSILGAWRLQHPACNVRDAATYAPYMQERSDPLSVMLVPRKLATDLMPHQLHWSLQAPTTLQHEADACMMLYQARRVEWEHEVAHWMQQQEGQRAMRNERLAAVASRSGNVVQCCESYPATVMSEHEECWSTAGSYVTEDTFEANGAISSLPIAPPVCYRIKCEATQQEGTQQRVIQIQSDTYSTLASTQTATSTFGGKSSALTLDFESIAVHSAATNSAGECENHNNWSGSGRSTWGSMVSFAAQPMDSPRFLSADNWSNEIDVSVEKNDPVLFDHVVKHCGADQEDDDIISGGHLPSCLLNDSSDDDEDDNDEDNTGLSTVSPRREQRRSSHPIDGDDWLDQDLQQQPLCKATPQASWFRRRRSESPPFSRLDANYKPTLCDRSPRFTRNQVKPMSASDRGARRSFFSHSPELSRPDVGASSNHSPAHDDDCFKDWDTTPIKPGLFRKSWTTTFEDAAAGRPRLATETTMALNDEY